MYVAKSGWKYFLLKKMPRGITIIVNNREGGFTMEEERDIVVFSDDEGNEFELEVIDYFDYEGQEYAVLIETDCECDCEDEECECEQDVYIMKIVVNGDMEEFLPADEDLLDTLAAIAEKRLSEDFEEEEE